MSRINKLLDHMYKNQTLFNFYLVSLISSDNLHTCKDYERALKRVEEVDNFLHMKPEEETIFFRERIKDFKDILNSEYHELLSGSKNVSE